MADGARKEGASDRGSDGIALVGYGQDEFVIA